MEAEGKWLSWSRGAEDRIDWSEKLMVHPSGE